MLNFFTETTTIYYTLGGLLILYVIGAYVFLVIDNRSPQSTFAWLFLFYIFPLGGIVIYILFGRGRHSFSNESKLLKQVIGGDLSKPLTSWLTRQDETIKKLKKESPPALQKLLELLCHNSAAYLTTNNSLHSTAYRPDYRRSSTRHNARSWGMSCWLGSG